MVEITAFRLESNFPPMRTLEFIRDHVTFKLPYDFSYHMKTPIVAYRPTVYRTVAFALMRWVEDDVLLITFWNESTLFCWNHMMLNFLLQVKCRSGNLSALKYVLVAKKFRPWRTDRKASAVPADLCYKIAAVQCSKIYSVSHWTIMHS